MPEENTDRKPSVSLTHTKLRLTRDLLIHPAHGARKGRTFLVMEQESGRDARTWFIGNRGEPCACFSHEREIFEDVNPECPIDTVSQKEKKPILHVLPDALLFSSKPHVPALCGNCSGTGNIDNGEECSSCNGTGIEPI